MLNKNFSTSLFIAAIAVLIGISSLNAQEMGKVEMMKKHKDMQQTMKSVDVKTADLNSDGKVFACTMGCEVKDEAGRCGACEMKLKEMSLDDASKLIASKGFKVVDESVTKPDCGADCTKPCRDGKKGAAMMKVKMDKKECAADCTKPCCTKKGEAASDAKAWNKVCPMSGAPIDLSVPTVSYNGKEYGFCNSSCISHFKSDPEKYSKNLSKDGGKHLGT